MKLQAIRLIAVTHRPYFGVALHSLRLVATDKVPTMQTDRHGRVYVNTNRIGGKGGWTLQQAAAVLVHELNHWIRRHFDRVDPVLARSAPEDKSVDAYLVNLCEDMEINDDLGDDRLKLPEEGTFPKDYGLPEHLLWEEYYERFPRDRVKVVTIDCGSAAHGQPGGYEEPVAGDQTVLSSAEQDLIRRQTAEAIRDFSARNPGTVSAGLQRWAGTILRPPTIPWERELAALVRNAITMARGQIDYSYARPSRRQHHARVILPAMVRPDIEAAVVVDTSGSMSDSLLAAALREVQGILRVVGQRRVPVLCCDADVCGGVQRVSNALDVKLSGGGGTDMGVGIAAAEQLHASVIIVLTDGYTPWPATPPKRSELVIGLINAPEDHLSSHFETPSYAKRVLRIRVHEGEAAA